MIIRKNYYFITSMVIILSSSFVYLLTTQQEIHRPDVKKHTAQQEEIVERPSSYQDLFDRVDYQENSIPNQQQPTNKSAQKLILLGLTKKALKPQSPTPIPTTPPLPKEETTEKISSVPIHSCMEKSPSSPCVTINSIHPIRNSPVTASMPSVITTSLSSATVEPAPQNSRENHLLTSPIDTPSTAPNSNKEELCYSPSKKTLSAAFPTHILPVKKVALSSTKLKEQASIKKSTSTNPSPLTDAFLPKAVKNNKDIQSHNIHVQDTSEITADTTDIVTHAPVHNNQQTLQFFDFPAANNTIIASNPDGYNAFLYAQAIESLHVSNDACTPATIAKRIQSSVYNSVYPRLTFEEIVTLANSSTIKNLYCMKATPQGLIMNGRSLHAEDYSLWTEKISLNQKATWHILIDINDHWTLFSLINLPSHGPSIIYIDPHHVSIANNPAAFQAAEQLISMLYSRIKS